MLIPSSRLTAKIRLEPALAIGLRVLVQLQPLAEWLFRFRVGLKLDRLGLPLHGRGEVADLGVGGGERVEPLDQALAPSTFSTHQISSGTLRALLPSAPRSTNCRSFWTTRFPTRPFVAGLSAPAARSATGIKVASNNIVPRRNENGTRSGIVSSILVRPRPTADPCVVACDGLPCAESGLAIVHRAETSVGGGIICFADWDNAKSVAREIDLQAVGGSTKRETG